LEILSIIPARGGSKGIPLKNLAKINGKPMLYYTINSSLKSTFITRTIVSTENKKIATVAQKLGAEIVQRPKKLAVDSTLLEPVVDHVLSYLERKEKYVPDIIVTLQITSPLRTIKHIDESIKKFSKGKYDSLISGKKSHLFLWDIDKNQKINPVNYDPQKRPNRQEMKHQLIENGAIYITKYDFFKKSHCRIGGAIGYYEMSEDLSIDVDEINDLKNAEKIMKQKHSI
jgi:CMP-N,N'-diacetyllegionaminic acid synthase